MANARSSRSSRTSADPATSATSAATLTPNPRPTQAISIRQPWAWAIAAGFKTLENRSRLTNFRGRVAVHASDSSAAFDNPDNLNENLYDVHPLIFECLDNPKIDEGGEDYDFNPFVFGAIFGSVEIVDCIRFDPSTDDPDDIFGHLPPSTGPAPEIPHGVWASGPHCYVLRNARRYRCPVICRGSVALPWKIPSDLLATIADCEGDLLTDPSEPIDSRNVIVVS